MTNEINTLSDAVNTLSQKTEQFLDKYDNGDKINTTSEKNISKRFDTLARYYSQMIQWRKETGSKQFDKFFE
ncbi:MAG TPA: hypothetical protein VK982_05630 [Bacteroidales bacterium]|nr:hypothetical protein [Bacteroidales bacterium]